MVLVFFFAFAKTKFMKIVPSERETLRWYQEWVFSLVPFSPHECPPSMLLLKEDTHFLFFHSRPSPMWHRGGGTGCAPCVVSGGGQLFSAHACWGASCFKPIASPSCYRTQLGRKIHPFGHYWHHLDKI